MESTYPTYDERVLSRLRTRPQLWSVSTRGSKKRIHRRQCRYAKHDYKWAEDRSERELFDELLTNRSFAWHDACLICSPDLDYALHRARIQAGIEKE